MKRYISLSLLSCFLIFFSCGTTNKLIREKLRSLEGQRDVTVVLFCNSLFGGRGVTEIGSSYRRYLRPRLEDLLGGRISIINSSMFEDTFNSAKRRVEEDILSYRPDIVFLMLGLVDANLPSLSEITYREHVKELFDILKKYETFVIVLTATGFRDYNSVFDLRLERLKEFNEITIWEAGLHRFPVMDVAQYMDRLRITAPEEYRSMFIDDYHLNENGQKYIMEYVIERMKRSF